LEAGAKLGWGWATVRRAKTNVGAQSFKKGGEWWWFDPKTYSPIQAPPLAIAKTPSARIFEKIPEKSPVVEERNLPLVLAPVVAPSVYLESPKPPSRDFLPPERSIENGTAASTPAAPPQVRAPELPKPVAPRSLQAEPPKTIGPPKPLEPPKPPRLHIWNSALAETRESLISTAGFTDLYIMRADIHLRQEQLHAKGLLKEEAALNDLVSRINEAVEKKKKQENLE
jgi:hypothetical protein